MIKIKTPLTEALEYFEKNYNVTDKSLYDRKKKEFLDRERECFINAWIAGREDYKNPVEYFKDTFD